MKKGPALIAAFVMTFCIGALMVALGVNALLNPTSVQAADTPGQSQAQNVSAPAGNDAQAQIEQLQARIKEYQDREKQYQAQLDQSQQQMSEANNELQQYQSLLQQLQQMGIIHIDRRGQISVPRGFGDGDD